jgi:predicted enzyme involved in methoxymalonyl-ACP biosynthesis
VGRHLEAWILSEIIKRVSKFKGNYVITEFIKTERNSIALEFLNTYGFDKINNNSHLKKSLESLHHQISNATYYLNIKDVKIPNLEVYRRIEK